MTNSEETMLGRLERVDLRSIWNNEARDFTPWLAQEENLKLLGDAIGIELELEAQEQEVGVYWADIVCRDTATDQRVLIENQLEKTDHSHLGQIMTYAAGLEANTVVWIARRFTEEHRAAIDWLNHVTGEDFNFFGLEVELWRIGGSAVAPKFNIVGKPNDWSKSLASRAKEASSGELTASKQLQLEFWTAFRDWVQDQSTAIRPTKPSPQHWMTMSIGRSGVHLNAIASLWDSLSQTWSSHELRVELVLSDKNSKFFYAQLEAERPAIEAEYGASLTWLNPEDIRACRIYLRQEANLNDRTRWEEYHAWLLAQLEAFRRVFEERVKRLETASDVEVIG